MLFDNNELSRVFTSDGLVYFNEILQSYYNKSYRSAVVLLYSFYEERSYKQQKI